MNVGIIKKNKVDYVTSVGGNRETTNISAGTPIVFVMDGTNDGFDFQKPSSGNATKSKSFPAGILLATAIAGQVSNNILVYGIAQQTLVSATITRSATSAAWASAVGFNAGDVLTINTLANVLEFLSAGSALTQQNNFCAVGTVATVTTQASTLTFPQVNTLGGASTDTIAYITSLQKVYVRCM
jgi:hypothetical protein